MTTSETRYVFLDQIESGANVIVRGLEADREINGRFMLLGLAVGTKAEVIQNDAKGPLLVRARNSFVAIGREEARHVLVEVSP